jgi:hypothetical protein
VGFQRRKLARQSRAHEWTTYDQEPSRGIGAFAVERPRAQSVGRLGPRSGAPRLPELGGTLRGRFSRTFCVLWNLWRRLNGKSSVS